jgi:hypothetical protein
MNDARYATDTRIWDLKALDEAWARHRARATRVFKPADRNELPRPKATDTRGSTLRPF